MTEGAPSLPAASSPPAGLSRKKKSTKSGRDYNPPQHSQIVSFEESRLDSVNTSVLNDGLPRAAVERRRLQASHLLVLLAATILCAAGCGVTQKARSMFGGQLPFEVVIAPDANEDSPVAVDLIFVYDKKLLDTLLKTPATEWFAKREQFVKDYGNALAVEKWEWVPGQQIERLNVSYRPGARRVVLFADYLTEGDHRATADPQEPFRLVLGARDFSVEKLQ